MVLLESDCCHSKWPPVEGGTTHMLATCSDPSRSSQKILGLEVALCIDPATWARPATAWAANPCPVSSENNYICIERGSPKDVPSSEVSRPWMHKRRHQLLIILSVLHYGVHKKMYQLRQQPLWGIDLQPRDLRPISQWPTVQYSSQSLQVPCQLPSLRVRAGWKCSPPTIGFNPFCLYLGGRAVRRIATETTSFIRILEDTGERVCGEYASSENIFVFQVRNGTGQCRLDTRWRKISIQGEEVGVETQTWQTSWAANDLLVQKL